MSRGKVIFLKKKRGRDPANGSPKARATRAAEWRCTGESRQRFEGNPRAKPEPEGRASGCAEARRVFSRDGRPGDANVCPQRSRAEAEAARSVDLGDGLPRGPRKTSERAAARNEPSPGLAPATAAAKAGNRHSTSHYSFTPASVEMKNLAPQTGRDLV